MSLFKKLERLVNTIKKYKNIIYILALLISTKSLAFSPEYEKEMYIGCYGNSKIYLGPEGAKKYCLCTINKLSNRYSNEEINLIFKKNPEEIMKATDFASIECAKNK